MLYMSLLHELEEESLNWFKIFSIRKRQVEFELDLNQTGRFGEIREWERY